MSALKIITITAIKYSDTDTTPEFSLKKYPEKNKFRENIDFTFIEYGGGNLVHFNLIPINNIEGGKYTKSSMDNIIKFRDYLNDRGITATIRRELGSDINAACGQLRRQNLKQN